MRVLLIDPPWYSLQGISSSPPALGLGYLGAYLEKHRHKCLIFSGEVGITKKFKHQKVVIDDDEIEVLGKSQAYKKVLSKLSYVIDRFNPDIFGITMPTVKYPVVKEMLKFLKAKKPNAKIVVGGPHPTILPENSIKIEGIDFAVRGEGEKTFLELVNAIEKNAKDFSKIKGITYKKNGKIVHTKDREQIQNLDELPFPNWDLLYEKEKIPHNLLGHVISSRGCPYLCIFCASKKIWGLNVRFRSPENIIQEVREKKKKYGVDVIVFNDDSFTLNRERILKILDLLKKEKISWKCDTRVNLVDYDILKKMKEAGCVQLNLGVECGNDKMLKYVKKGITIEQVERAFKIAKKLKIGTVAYFMMGFPDENLQDVKDGINLMKRIKPDHPTWSTATPYPGTELYDICQKYNLIPKEIDWATYHHHSKNMCFSKNIKKEDFVKLAQKIEKITFWMKVRYYLSHPKRLLKELKII